MQLPVVLDKAPAPRAVTKRMSKIELLRASASSSPTTSPPCAPPCAACSSAAARTSSAVDGAEAEARLAEQRFDLVILDVTMPGRGGYEVLPTVRALQPEARAILMSGYTERSGESEPDAFLEKPFTAKTLDQTIDDVLLIPRAAAAAGQTNRSQTRETDEHAAQRSARSQPDLAPRIERCGVFASSTSWSSPISGS